MLTGGKLRLFDPIHPYMKKTVKNYSVMSMLEPIFVDGEQVYTLPSLEQIRVYHQSQLDLFWPEYLRKLNPEIYRVNLSQEAWELKQRMLEEYMSLQED
ncbi:nicotinate phosphoribosyltransferase [compost metagenome]